MAISRMSGVRRWLAVIGLVVALFLFWTIATLPVPQSRFGDPHRVASGSGAVLDRVTGRPGDWAGTGGDPGGSQWSPLDQMRPDTIDKLKIAWISHSGDYKEGDTYTGTRMEFIPLVVDRTLYYC